MKCNCKEELEAKLTERFANNTPASSAHKVNMRGYGLCLTGNALELRAGMEYEAYALVPLKSGGSKPKKTKGTMVFSFCPFCGASATTAPEGEKT